MLLDHALLSDDASARAAPRFCAERFGCRTAEGVCLRQEPWPASLSRRPSPLLFLCKWRAAAPSTRCDQHSAPERNAPEQRPVSTMRDAKAPRLHTEHLPKKEGNATLRAAPLWNLRVCKPLLHLPRHPLLRCYPIAGASTELGVIWFLRHAWTSTAPRRFGVRAPRHNQAICNIMHYCPLWWPSSALEAHF